MDGALPEVVRRRLDPVQRFGLRLVLAGVAIVVVAVPFCTLLFEVLAKGPLAAPSTLGSPTASTTSSTATQRWSGSFELVSWLGRPPLLALLVVAALVFLVRRRQHRLVWFLAVTPLGGGIVDSLVKLAVNRPRPVVDHPVVTALGKSFPSGHAMSSLVTYGALLSCSSPSCPAGDAAPSSPRRPSSSSPSARHGCSSASTS